MEENDVLAEPAHPLDVARWVDRRTEHAGRRGLQSHELRYTLAAVWSCQGGTETERMRLAGWRSCARWPLPTAAIGGVHQPAAQGGTAQPPQLAELP